MILIVQVLGKYMIIRKRYLDPEGYSRTKRMKRKNLGGCYADYVLGFGIPGWLGLNLSYIISKP